MKNPTEKSGKYQLRCIKKKAQLQITFLLFRFDNVPFAER